MTYVVGSKVYPLAADHGRIAMLIIVNSIIDRRYHQGHVRNKIGVSPIQIRHAYKSGLNPRLGKLAKELRLVVVAQGIGQDRDVHIAKCCFYIRVQRGSRSGLGAGRYGTVDERSNSSPQATERCEEVKRPGSFHFDPSPRLSGQPDPNLERAWRRIPNIGTRPEPNINTKEGAKE